METRRRRGPAPPPPPPPPPPPTLHSSRPPVPPPPPPPTAQRRTANETDSRNDGSAFVASALQRDARESQLSGRRPDDAPQQQPAAVAMHHDGAQTADAVAMHDVSSEAQREDPSFVLVGRQEANWQGVGGRDDVAQADFPATVNNRFWNELHDDSTMIRAANRNTRREETAQATDATEPPAEPSWIVTVRAPDRSVSGLSNYGSPSSLLHVQVSNGTSPQELSEGIRHALQLDTALPIPGLFDEDSGIYYFMSDVLVRSRDTPHRRIFCLLAPRPKPHDEAKRGRIHLPDATRLFSEWFRARPTAAAAALLIVFMGLSVARSVLHQVLGLLRHAVASPTELLVHGRHWLRSALQESHQRAIVLPLKDMYRNGPWIVGGWEGDRLERVCSRITFHGDEAFWSRNAGECERIYAAKEEAWLCITRPLVNLVLLVTVALVVMKALRRPTPRRLSPTERDALESYRAIQVLIRLLKKNS